MREAPAPDWRQTLRKRTTIAAILVGVWIVGIEARLVMLQIVERADLAARATRQQMSRSNAAAKRGDILDRRGQVLATEPLRERLYDRPHYARGGYDYWQQLPDGRLVIGGNRDASLDTEETELEETTSLIQDRLEVLVEQLVGHRPEVTDRWAGIWGTTPDRVPLVGEVRDKVWVAGGYSGHGNALGLACGDLVARAIVGEASPELELFDPARRFLPAG